MNPDSKYVRGVIGIRRGLITRQSGFEPIWADYFRSVVMLGFPCRYQYFRSTLIKLAIVLIGAMVENSSWIQRVWSRFTYIGPVHLPNQNPPQDAPNREILVVGEAFTDNHQFLIRNS